MLHGGVLAGFIVAAVMAGTWHHQGGAKARGPGRSALAVSTVEWFGDLGLFFARLLRSAISPPYEIAEFIRQCDAIGSKSLPLVALTGAATGVVMALEAHDSLSMFGAGSLLPSLIVYSVINESGPIITSLVISGRVGAGIGAELGSMKVTEQIDAMEASAVDPLRYLVATRVLACVLMLPLLTVAADFFGVVTGWVAATLFQPISFRFFMESGFKYIHFSEFIPPTLKTAIFGLIIGVVACFQGMRTKGGTEGVGRSVTSAVVLSSLFVIVADVVLVKLIQVLFPST